MGLFTDPVVLNDGAADRTFSYGGQLMDPSATKASEWIEGAADPMADSKIVVKHTVSKTGIKRSLVQRVENVDLPEGASELTAPCVINLTISRHPQAASADIAKQLAIMADAMAETGFLNNLLVGQI